tara:strand:- start:670 stop:1404 length:735 start_codon:yes stop_codon:yes gene_type:complete
MTILVIGESCVDEFIYGSSSRLAPEAPAPVFVPNHATSNIGMAGNVAENLKSLGAQVELLTNKNVIKKTRYVDEKTNHLHLRIDIGDLNTKQIVYEDLAYFKQFEAIVISDYCKGFLSEDDIFKICNIHNNVFIDTKKILNKKFINAKFIKINNLEYKASEQEINRTPGLIDKIIITTGKDGCIFKGNKYGVSKVEVKDQVGAGDTFIASFVYKYLKTGDVDNSIKFANDCATVVVSKRGVAII